jgi:6-phosphogluconolactonase
MILSAASSGASFSHVRVLSDREAMSAAAAEQIVALMQQRLTTQDRFTIALAGGGTPRPVYELLATTYRDAVPWERVHLFWGDERYVPHDDPASNVRLVRDSLLDGAPIPDANVHPMPTGGGNPSADATAYEDTLRDFFPDEATFDLVLLGLGGDGHTASLFPTDDRATSLGDALPWVRAVEAPPRHDVRTRLSLTLPAINRAHSTFFLVAGANKHDAVVAVLQDQDRSLPPTHVRPRQKLIWFLDEAARFGQGD